MPTNTPNLDLYKYNTATDGNMTYNITNCLNNNWDKIDTYCKSLSDNKADTTDVNTALTLKADKTVLHALKGYEDAGELLTDVEGLSDVEKYAHSSFDLSKFTVVGSPIITSDGIASGFNSSNDIKKTSLTFSGNTLVIQGEYTWNGTTSTGSTGIFSLRGTDCYMTLYQETNNNLRLYTNVSNTSYYDLANFNISANISFKYTITLTSSSLNITGYQNSTKVTDQTVTTHLPAISDLTDFEVSTFGITTQGSIDLKQLSITVDGVEVFSGNKTGIDTIKPDDYTVEGTPTISDDGIVSNFSSTNRLTYDTGLDSTITDLEIYTQVQYIQNTQATDHGVIMSPTLANGPFQINNRDGRVGIWTGTQWLQGSTYYNDGDIIDLKVTYKNSLVTIYSKLAGTEYWTQEQQYSRASNCFGGTLSIGRNTVPATEFFYGKINLNATKLYVNGNLVWQPCLKIPYTLSKTGSKVVNAVYRDRVVDMYEQFGYSNYYTLQEDNVPNYTVVGSPTISGDYIASGFSSSNYIQLPDIYSNFSNKPWKIEFNGTLAQGVSPINLIGAGWAQSDAITLGRMGVDNSDTVYLYMQGTQGTIIRAYTFTATNTDVLDGYIEFTGTKYKFYCIKNGDTSNPITTEVNSTDTLKLNTSHTTNLSIGYKNSTGSIDLKQLKIYVDNKLAYQAVQPPCFTLPQGEVYGMIGRLQQLSDNEIGLPVPTLSNTLYDNEIWLEGAEVSKTTYAKLYAIYGDDYGTPTDSANFILPNFTDRVMQGIGSGGTWGYIEAGLPNITGQFNSGRVNETGVVSGAFYVSASGTGFTDGGGNFGYYCGFNASRSSAIYGASTTVQPPAIKVRVKTRYQ